MRRGHKARKGIPALLDLRAHRVLLALRVRRVGLLLSQPKATFSPVMPQPSHAYP